MEFSARADSLAFRQRMVNTFKFEDISPIWGAKTVKTFKKDPAIIKQWPQFQTDMLNVSADWYYVGGHHSRRRGDLDPKFDGNREVGFFNNIFHHHTWTDETHSDPDDVFMWTSIASGAMRPLGLEANPLLARNNSACKGVILAGCHTLTYRFSRIAWMNAFPDAYIVGVIGKTSGKALFKPIKTVMTKKFFEDPSIIAPEDLCLAFAKNYYRPQTVGVIHQTKLYYTWATKPLKVNVANAADKLWGP